MVYGGCIEVDGWNQTELTGGTTLIVYKGGNFTKGKTVLASKHVVFTGL
jgi:hypothetical protein